MTYEEHFHKYIKEQCKNCKNKNEDLCCVRITKLNNIITTMCLNYCQEKQQQGYIEPLKRTAKLKPRLMQKLISDWSMR